LRLSAPNPDRIAELERIDLGQSGERPSAVDGAEAACMDVCVGKNQNQEESSHGNST
jgi:hypothetical protein